MRRRLQFPITRHVFVAALLAFAQAVAAEEAPPEPEPVAVGQYL